MVIRHGQEKKRTDDVFTFLFIRLPGYHTEENAIAVVARIRVLSLSLSLSLNALAYLSAFHSIFRNPSIQVIDSVSSDTPCMYMCAAHIVSVCVTHERYTVRVQTRATYVARRLIGAYLAKDGEPSGFHVITRSGLSRLRITVGLNHLWR